MNDEQKQLAIKCLAKAIVVSGMLASCGKASVLISLSKNYGLAERAAALVFEHMLEMKRWGVVTPRIMRLLLDQLVQLADES